MNWKEESAARRDFRAIKTDGATSSSRKKNKKRWCKGRVGVEHILVIVKDERLRAWPCLPNRLFGCCHHEICTVCGKEMRWNIPPKECPVLTPPKNLLD